jgi:hypothetical protein
MVSNKRRAVSLAVVVVVILGLVVALIFSALGAGNGPAKVKAAPKPTASASPDPYSVWYGNGTGIGYTDLKAVQTDLNNLNTDVNNGVDPTSDATQLEADASTALSDPMPVDPGKYPDTVTGDYITMMGAFEAAGQHIADGNDNAATTELDLGTDLTNTITAALNKADGN